MENVLSFTPDEADVFCRLCNEPVNLAELTTHIRAHMDINLVEFVQIRFDKDVLVVDENQPEINKDPNKCEQFDCLLCPAVLYLPVASLSLHKNIYLHYKKHQDEFSDVMEITNYDLSLIHI